MDADEAQQDFVLDGMRYLKINLQNVKNFTKLEKLTFKEKKLNKDNAGLAQW